MRFFLAALPLLASSSAIAQIMPPAVDGLTIPANVDPDAYCFMLSSVAKSVYEQIPDSPKDTPTERKDLETQREALSIGAYYYAGALSRRFDLAGINAEVAKSIRSLTNSDVDIPNGLRCAYIARDRMHEIANGMRVALGMRTKKPN